MVVVDATTAAIQSELLCVMLTKKLLLSEKDMIQYWQVFLSGKTIKNVKIDTLIFYEVDNKPNK